MTTFNSSAYPLESAQEFTLWRHKKGGLYICLGVAPDSTNDNEDVPFVVYWSLAFRKKRIRLASQFLDGRFTLLDALGSPIQPGQHLKNPKGEVHGLTPHEAQAYPEAPDHGPMPEAPGSGPTPTDVDRGPLPTEVP